MAIPFALGPVCPVRALEEWLRVSGVAEGPVFRPVSRSGKVDSVALSGEAVIVIVKTRARAAGLDADRYSGHSLRAGFATSAARAGVPVWKIKVQTRHVSDAMGRPLRAAKRPLPG